MTGYARKFNENLTMSFRVKDKQLLKNYNKIWEKVEKLMKTDFESRSVYSDDDKCIKTKIKIYAKNTITNFHNKKMAKEKAPCKCLPIIMIDSVIKANKKYYPQILLEECKYMQEKIKTENYINKDLEKSESDSDSNMRPNLILIMKNNLLNNITYNFLFLLLLLCLDFFASRYFFWYCFNFHFFSSDILSYLFFPYSLFLFLSSSGRFLYLSLACSFNLSLSFS